MSLKIKHLKEPDKPLGSQHTTANHHANCRISRRQFASIALAGAASLALPWVVVC